jgi:tetratricopeptide (TPR) repeat protein
MARVAQKPQRDMRLLARAEELRALSYRTDVFAAAAALESEAIGTDDHVVASMAAQVVGLIWLHRGDLEAGGAALRRALAHAHRAEDPGQASRVHTSLVRLHLLAGDLPAAEESGRVAAEAARGIDAACLDMELAVVAERGGRLEEALAAFDAAEAVLQAGGDPLTTARLRFNRAVVLAQLGRLADAERDTERAAAVIGAGGGTAAALVALNRAWLAALAADVPRALALYDDALAVARAADMPGGLVLRDRADLLSAVGLWSEAIEVAEAAVESLDRASPADAAEARLILAQALLGGGRPGPAGEVAAAAAGAFTAQGRPAWAARARLVRFSADLRAGAETGDMIDGALAAVASLEQAGLRAEATEGRSLAARLAIATGRPVPASLLPLVPPVGPPWVRAGAWPAEAERRLAAGDRGGARRAVLAGLRPLDDLRAMLGSVELRSGVAAIAGELGELGVALAAGGSSTRHLLMWAERRSAAVRHHAPCRPDPKLAEALVALRAASGRLAAAADNEEETKAIGALAVAETDVRRLARHTQRLPGTVQSGRPPSADVGLAEVMDRAGESAIVRFVQVGGHLSAVVLVGGRVTRHDLAVREVIAAAIDRLRFGVTRLAAGGPAALRTQAMLTAAAEDLDQRVFGPLRRRLAGRPLVLVPDGALHTLPWRALPSLSAVPFCVAPSVASWSMAAELPTARGAGVFVAGPGLAGADDEVRAAAAAWRPRRSKVLTGTAATGAVVRTALDGAAYAHLACHGTFRVDNPQFSALELVDGPFTVVDLQLVGRVPAVVVLASCDAGRAHSVAGAEAVGVAAGFLGAGSRTTVACVLPVADAAIARLAVHLTARVGAGMAPAEALAVAANLAMGTGDPTDRAAAFAMCCFGAG